MADPQVNFFSSTLVGGYTDSDTELTLATGSGASLPDPSTDGAFNLVIYNESEIFVTTTFDGGSTDTRQDLASTNPEIVRVSARSGDVLTVARAQEGTTASAKESDNTYRVILASTKKVFDDINDAIANVDLTTLTGVEELTFDSAGDEEFGLPAGTTAQRPSSPSAGYMRYNTDTKKLEIHTGGVWGLVSLDNVIEMQTAQLSVTANDAVFLPPLEVEYLVIAGGGGGGAGGAGGGAGGYRSSVSGESSGGGASAESALTLDLSTNYTITVGAGGAGKETSETGTISAGSSGSNSVFSTITSTAGGGGGSASGAGDSGLDGLNGGSGGGAAQRGTLSFPEATPGNGTASQGFGGGTGNRNDSHQNGGGGGASTVGGEPPSTSVGADGGSGVISSITGSAVGRAGGGGAGVFGSDTAGGATDGGGAGANNTNTGSSGTVNTGGGGGGGGVLGGSPFTRYGGGSGGSGVVILRYPSSYSITIGAGLTGSETTVGGNKVATITAGTGNVSWTTS